MTFAWRLPIEKQDDTMVMAAITTEGKSEAENLSSGGPRFDVLATLNEKSPMTLSAICHETNLDMSQVKHVLRSLAKEGYVRKVQSQEGIV